MSDQLFGVGAIVSAFIGGIVGVFCDRVFETMVSRPLFRLHMGYFQHIQAGEGLTLSVENVGFTATAEYSVRLYHPKRGSLEHFLPEGKTVFPQHPGQRNHFRFVLKPLGSDPITLSGIQFLRRWLQHERDKSGERDVVVPTFEGFVLSLRLANSERQLFANEALGNYIAKEMFQMLTGSKTSQVVEPAYYVSKAPFFVEWLKRHRERQMLKQLRSWPPRSGT